MTQISNSPDHGLAGARVLLVGASSGIATATARALVAGGAHVVLAGRDLDRTRTAAGTLGDDVTAVRIDLQDESSIADAAAELGAVDHVVSLAAAHANGPVDELERVAVQRAFDAKVVGPILLAKHFAGSMPPGGAFVLFSGVAAWKPAPGLGVMATTNGAVAFLVEALAVELAPVRAVAVSPGIVDSGAWDGAADRDEMFDATARSNPVRRIGTPDDVARAVLYALSDGFVTGTTLHVDGGGRLT